MGLYAHDWFVPLEVLQVPDNKAYACWKPKGKVHDWSTLYPCSMPKSSIWSLCSWVIYASRSSPLLSSPVYDKVQGKIWIDKWRTPWQSFRLLWSIGRGGTCQCLSQRYAGKIPFFRTCVSHHFLSWWKQVVALTSRYIGPWSPIEQFGRVLASYSDKRERRGL